tara:strand:- start:260 stop:1000 length:741 start_codon:yes stop_codon:yes gene_type:complete
MDVSTKKDNLFNLFSNLPFDIQEIIYNDVLIIQDTDKNKRMFSGKVINELQYNIREYNRKTIDENEVGFIEYMIDFDLLNYLYEEFSIGCRVTENNIERKLDELYYEDLDYLMLCDISTNINIDTYDIDFSYKLKDNNLIFNKNQSIEFEDGEIDEYFGFIKDKTHTIAYHLIDWIQQNFDYDALQESDINFMHHLMESDFDIIGKDVDCLKRYFYDIGMKFNVFYNRIENETHYNNQLSSGISFT